MMEITCDACRKRYRIDETRMKSETAKVRCKACGHLMQVSRPPTPHLADTIFGNDDSPERSVAASDIVAAAQVVGNPATAIPIPEVGKVESTVDSTEAPAFAAPPKVRFGLFGKTLLVMLLISLLPFG